MDFHELLSKMQEIDTAKTEAAPLDQNTDECGMNEMPPMMAPDMQPPAEPKDKARMNVNISAEGDAIDDILKLMTKVNPDMINQPEKPEMPDMPDMTIAMPKPINKLIPDFDGDNDDKPGGDMDMDMGMDKDDHDADHDMIKGLDKDDDGDHDMDDHDAEKKDKEEAYANEPDEDHRDIDYMQNKLSGGMNRPKGTHPKVADGDNPMKKVKEGDDLRAQIKAELAQRLAEAKGEK